MLRHGVIVVLLALLIIRILYNYARLRSIPGPVAARVSGLWQKLARKSSADNHGLGGLHRWYGSVVRIKPNTVSLSDPATILRLYDRNIRLKKDSYTESMDYNKLQQYEGIIDQPAKSLISALQGQQTLDIVSSLEIFILGFVRQTVTNATLRPAGAPGKDASTSTLEYLLLSSPFMKLKRERQGIFSSTTRQPPWTTSSVSELPDYLCFTDDEGTEPERDSREYLEVLRAGVDTISTGFISALVSLVRYPEAMARIRNEIDTASLSGHLSDPPRWGEVCRLSYLDAVLKESIRHGPSEEFVEKSIPTDGMTVNGHFLPVGTIVEWQLDAFHYDQDIYGDKVQEFQPERWLSADPCTRKHMEQALLAFNISRRACVAVRAVWLELKKLFVLMFLQFDMQIHDDTSPIRNELGTTIYPPHSVVNLMQRVH